MSEHRPRVILTPQQAVAWTEAGVLPADAVVVQERLPASAPGALDPLDPRTQLWVDEYWREWTRSAIKFAEAQMRFSGVSVGPPARR